VDHDCAGPGGLLRHYDAEAARAICDLLPGTAINIVAVLFGRSTAGSLGAAGEVASRLAFAILAAYTLACFALPVIVTRWRDILCCPAPGPQWAVRRDGKPGSTRISQQRRASRSRYSGP